MFSLTVQTANSGGGKLSMMYAKNGDAGGNCIEWPSARVGEYTIDENALEDFLVRAILTIAVKRGLTPAQLVGKTITVDPMATRNLIYFE